MANVQDCKIVVSKFELQSCYYFPFCTNALGKSNNAFILPVMGLRVPQLFFYTDGFGIK